MGRPLHPALPLALLLAAAPLRAQTPVEPYDVSGRYRTLLLNAQVTGEWDRGRDLLVAWGSLHAGGRMGSWMRRLEAAAGVTTGENFIERVLAGPQVSVARAFPGQFLSFGREARGDPYVILGAAAYGVADFVDGTEFSFAPAASAGVGVRLYTDEWDVDLATFEVVVENRFVDGESPQLFIRLGRAVPRRRTGREGNAPPGPP